jgi:carboxypeptidase PM20D1
MAPALVVAGTDTQNYASLADNSYRLEPLHATSEDLDRIHGVDKRIAKKDLGDMVRLNARPMRPEAQ